MTLTALISARFTLRPMVFRAWEPWKRRRAGAPSGSARRPWPLQRQLFRLWYRFRGGVSARGAPLTRLQLILKSLPLQKKFLALGQRYLGCEDREVRNLARALVRHKEKFFTFMEHEGVEPTNNCAERALRTA